MMHPVLASSQATPNILRVIRFQLHAENLEWPLDKSDPVPHLFTAHVHALLPRAHVQGVKLVRLLLLARNCQISSVCA